MDFQEMMSAASKNAKKANKEMSRIENEVKDEKSERQRQLEGERRLRIEMQRRKAEKLQETQRRKEEERKKTSTIPKKDGGVDQNALKAYYEKQQREKAEKAKKAEKDKEQLMKLRMQANGGKATKKIGKHFGLDPVELQIRFGGNNEHVETLQKRKVREDEEADFEKEKFQSGVYKAIQMKKKAEEKLRNSVKGPHRVSTSKSNSLAGLCSRHESSRDTFSPPKDGKRGEKEKKEEKPVKKKMQAAPPVDFKSLMAAASSISQGKSVKLDKLEAPRPRPPPPQPTVFKKPEKQEKPVKIPIKVEKKPEKKPAEVEKRKKAPTPEPPAANLPPFNPNKKYLPSDIRYKMQLQHLGSGGGGGATAQSSNNSNSMPSSSSSNSSKDRREIERQREKERERLRKLKRERLEREDREMERDSKIRKIAHKSSSSRREAELREQQMREKYKSKKSSSFCRGADDYSDDDEEEDRSDEEYDSDLDDFIDDTECDMDGLSRKELEETLRMVNRKYDKKKWSQREKQISERDMHSDYRRVQSEESFSKRAGFMEDLREATKGRSVKL